MNKSIFDKWAALPGKAEVALLSAPFTFPPSPSVALSEFKSCLTEAGISSRVLYPMFAMTHVLGMKNTRELSGFAFARGVNEYLFAHLTDAENDFEERTFVEAVFADRSEAWREEFTERLREYRCIAAQCVDSIACRVINMGACVVAASSIFSQQNASLAVFRRVKELDPEIVTLIGGFNVGGEMGACVLRNYPSADYVFFGEGDEVFAEVIRAARSGSSMPYGVLRREDLSGELPFRLTKNLDTVPMPDYGDFFEEITRERDGFYGECLLRMRMEEQEPDNYYPWGFERTVFLEGSRGCAWGQKQPCAFCSGNGVKNIYREKTPALLYEEIRRTLERWPRAEILLSDNMLGPAMRLELLPRLKAGPRPDGMFAEVLSSLGEDDLRELSEAGFNRVQPGTESLNDHLLRLMGKGSTGVRNVAFLKYARTWGINPSWNLLYGIPGEQEEDYEEMLRLIPLLSHLPPPLCAPITFERFSRYWKDPSDFGLELSPHPSCRYIWGDDPDRLENMSVYYEVTGGPFREVRKRNAPFYARLMEAVEEWGRLWEEKRVYLRMTRTPERISIFDARPCAVQIFTRLEGIDREIYDMAWKPLAPEAARRAFAGRYAPEEVDAAARKLIERRLMIRLSGLYLALAVPWKAAEDSVASEP